MNNLLIFLSRDAVYLYRWKDGGCPTVCVSGGGAGVDNAWEQEKPEARKMLVEAAESPPSTARFVSPLFATGHHTTAIHHLPLPLAKFHQLVLIVQMPTLQLVLRHELGHTLLFQKNYYLSHRI